MADIEVSILITVYNHQKFIAQCLDSLVTQKTNFKFEIVIGEDCSTDKSREIITEYAQKFPEIIKPILYTINQGSKKCPGKGNFTNTFYACKGKYIVHIEGDDYLTDNNKLQLQFDFLEKNKDASACFHNATIIFDDNSAPSYTMNPENQKDKILVTDFLLQKERWFMATASVMFRRNLLPDRFPQWFMNCKSGDIPLYCMLADKGYIGYLPQNMSVYRKHAAGLSMTDIHHDAQFIQNRIFMYNSINKYTNKKYNYLIKPILSAYYQDLSNSTQYKNNAIFSSIYIFNSWANEPKKNIFELLKNNGLSAIFYQKYLKTIRKLNRIIEN